MKNSKNNKNNKESKLKNRSKNNSNIKNSVHSSTFDNTHDNVDTENSSKLEKPNRRMSDTLDSYNAVVREDNRVTIKTDGGTITRSNLPSTGLNPDNNDFFEERANPLSSKGSY